MKLPMKLKDKWQSSRVAQLLGLQYPIIQGPFGGGLSSVNLAASVSTSGGLGSFGAHHLEGSQILQIAQEIRKKTDKPFALNLWVPFETEKADHFKEADFNKAVERLRPYYKKLNISEPRWSEMHFAKFDDQISAVLESQPKAFSFVFGTLDKDTIKDLKKRNIVTLGAATNVEEALTLQESGTDIIVASGSEAGGHRVSFLRDPDESPALSALIPQLADKIRIPIIAAGGIADGRGITSALLLGAEGVQVGTAFLACDESNASAAHKNILRSPQARYTALTKSFSGRYARGVKNQFMKDFKIYDNEIPPYPIQNWLTQPIRKAAGAQNDPDLLALWSGQNAPLLRYYKANEVFEFLVKDTERVLREL